MVQLMTEVRTKLVFAFNISSSWTHSTYCAMLRRSVMPNALWPNAWTVACQAPLSMGILQARILEWVDMPSSRGSFQTRESNPGLLNCRWILYHLSHQRSPQPTVLAFNLVFLSFQSLMVNHVNRYSHQSTHLSCMSTDTLTNPHILVQWMAW